VLNKYIKCLDFAVGAPWGGKNRAGVVYLYYGTKNKDFPLSLKQVIYLY